MHQPEDDLVHTGEFTEEAIPLVIFNEEKKIFELNEEGRQHLASLEGPLGIIAVAGMYRTGKSYLLNRMLLDRSNGFGVGPTINPCTKGVWMWGKPIDGLTPDGDPIKVIILDTEGLGALDEDSNHDVRIFSLAILLSSFFIYNSVGSIDENALQNLSLVINLTKHIQIKGGGIQEDMDPTEFAKYFPSFMWVVRDFTLQLIDQEGEQMSSKEYLEKALSNQKGFSDSVEQKNRIRRLLKSFFDERDCITMIRPLTNEEKLQNLINIPLEELRPEFVDQIHTLRRKVLHRVKPKKIHGKNLNGTMFWNLMNSYVEAINKGAIPSIESSWAYICKNECLKAADDSYDIFVKTLKDEIQSGGLFYDTELKDFFNAAKKEALTHFTKVAVGDVKESFLEEFKEKMKQKFNQIKQDNEQSCEQECVMFLRNSYTEVERALKNQQYPRFIDFLHDIEQIKHIFEESGPPGTARKEIMLDFCIKAVMEAAEFFLQNTTNEAHLQQTLAEEQIRKFQSELQEIKSDNKEKFENLEQKLRKADIQNAELQAKEQSVREQLHSLENDKQQSENQLNQKLQSQKKDYERQLDEHSSKLNNAEDHKKEIQRQQQQSESEFDKQKALLDQKLEFLEKEIAESQKREKELTVELRNSKKDFLNQNKEQQQQLEKQIKDQLKQIEDFKEQIYEHENKHTELELQNEDHKNNSANLDEQLKKHQEKSKSSDAEWQKKHESLKKKYDRDMQDLKNTQDNDKLQNEANTNDIENQLKDTSEMFEQGKASWAKEKAVLEQKLEFIQYQHEDEKKKSQEQKQAHESMIRSIQSSNRESVIGREEAQVKINEMEQKFMNERRKQEEQYNEYRKTLSDQVEQLKKKNNEIELAKKLKEVDNSKEIAQLKEQLLEAEALKDEFSKKHKALEQKTSNSQSGAEERHKQKEAELEKMIEEKEQEIDELIANNQQKSSEQLAQIKNFYENEKQQIEKRFQDQKSHFDKKMQAQSDEHEDRLNEMQNSHDDQLNQHLEEKNANEADMQNFITQIQKENEMMDQQLQNKEKYLQELKESYANLQNSTNNQNEQINEKFSKERKDLNEKVEMLQSEISKRERQILTLENSKEGLSNQIKNHVKAHEETKLEHSNDKVGLGGKIEDIKKKHDSLLDEHTQSKIDFEREKALKDQKLQFLEQRNQEYKDSQALSNERYEERLRQEKDEHNKILNDRMQRMQQEKESVETKYDQKRKALKELEKSIQLSQSQSEREKAVQIEKYENLERQQKELIQNYEIENSKLRDQNDQLNNALNQGELGVREQVEHWKGQFYDIERQHADLQSEFEKEKALWEGKFEFLEKQKETAKKDQEEGLKQFQATIDQLQKVNTESKTKNEHNHGLVMQQLEQKFKKEIKEHQESNTNQNDQLQKNIKRLEKENKALNERLELTQNSNSSTSVAIERKIERITEERDNLRDEFETLKTDRDKKVDEMRRTFDREKEILRQKNTELQQKSKNTEGKQTELILEHETNRAKWEQEKSGLMASKEDLMQELKTIQRKQENSVKEIERLKEQNKRNNWRTANRQVGGMTTDNPVTAGVGAGLLNRFNLGGGGAGLGGGGALGAGLGQTQQSINMASYRSNVGGGVDKSMDNFKSAFGSKFGGGLGLGLGGKAGQQNDGNEVRGSQNFGSRFTGTEQPGSVPNIGLGAAMGNMLNKDAPSRSSNLITTPQSSKNKDDDDDRQ